MNNIFNIIIIIIIIIILYYYVQNKKHGSVNNNNIELVNQNNIETFVDLDTKYIEFDYNLRQIDKEFIKDQKENKHNYKYKIIKIFDNKEK